MSAQLSHSICQADVSFPRTHHTWTTSQFVQKIDPFNLMAQQTFQLLCKDWYKEGKYRITDRHRLGHNVLWLTERW